MQKTKAGGLHQDLDNDQAGPAESPQPPSLYRGCQSESRTTTQAVAQTSQVRFLPSVLNSDSYSSELKNGFSWEERSFLAMLTKYILVNNVWDGLKPTKHCMDSLISLNGRIKSCTHQPSTGVGKENQTNQPTRSIQSGVGTNGMDHHCHRLKFSKASHFSMSLRLFTLLLISEWVHSNFQ